MSETLIYGHTIRQALPDSLARNKDVIRLFIGRTKEPGSYRSGVENLRRMAGRRWNARMYDLLTVMCTLRAADRFFRSHRVFAISRDLPIACTVHNTWEALIPKLTRVVAELSSDRLHFSAVPFQKSPADAQPIDRDPPPRAYDADAVCLFSGGADSFCGVAHLLAAGRRPLLVSLSVGPIAGRQKHLFKALQKRFPHLVDEALIQVSPWPYAAPKPKEGRAPKRWYPRDQLQRLRSMFFFSLAAIVAQAHGVEEIFMCENGLIGAAIVFAADQDSPFTTHPAEPHFLRSMEDFLRSALAAPSLCIRNPFQYMTKGEILRECASLKLGRVLGRTVSCWRSGNRGVVSCGVCVPCMYRQLAFAESGVADTSGYLTPIPRGRAWRKWPSDQLSRLMSIRRYCNDAIGGGKQFLMDCERAVYDAIDVTAGATGRRATTATEQRSLDLEAPGRMADLILRFARSSRARLA